MASRPNRVIVSAIAKWFHNDIRDVSCLYVYGFFDSIKTISESNP